MMGQGLASPLVANLSGAARRSRWWQAPAYLLDGQAPVLAADFVGGRYMIGGAPKSVTDLLSVSSGVKWVVGASGALEQVPANTPAFGYSTGRRRLVVEGGATNVILNSPVLAPQSVSTAAITYTLSFKGTGSVTLSGSATGALAGTGAANRVRLTFAASSGTLNLAVSGTVTEAQIEAGGAATTYIPTGASQATRTPDVVSLPAAAVAVLNNTKGTAVFRGNTGWRSAQARLIRAAAPGAQPAVLAQNANDAVVIGGSTSGALTIKAAAGADVGASAGWSAAGRAGSVNGDVVVSDGAAMSFDFASLTLGGNTGPPSGTALLIDEIVIWAERGSDAALRAQARGWQ